MTKHITYRKALEKDIPFLVETIVAAEKSGTDKFSYSTLFGISEEEAKQIITEILKEDMLGQELCISDFIIAEQNNIYAGACNAWIEGATGTASTIIKANLLLFYFGKEKCLQAAQYSDLLNTIKFEREQGCLQLESAYVCTNFKGRGIGSRMMIEQIKKHHKHENSFNKIQIIIASSNINALKAYSKIGFKIVGKKYIDSPQVLNLLPSNHMYLLEVSYKTAEKYF